MPYATYNVSSPLEVVGAVADFALSLGWGVTRSGASDGAATIIPLGKTSSFTVTAISSASVQTNYLWVFGTGLTGNLQARTDFRPYSGWGGQPQLVHILGENGENPWLCAFIDIGLGSYRALAFGFLNKFGHYEGGEFTTTSTRTEANSPSPFTSATHSPYLFRAHYWTASVTTHTARGGVKVNNEWFGFFGGNGANDVLLIGEGNAPVKSEGVGKNTFSGYSPVLPINIYMGSRSPSDNFWTPIGWPDGIRQIDMRNFFPTQQIELPDGSLWRVFPALRKGNILPVGKEETSGPVGYAIREQAAA